MNILIFGSLLLVHLIAGGTIPDVLDCDNPGSLELIPCGKSKLITRIKAADGLTGTIPTTIGNYINVTELDLGLAEAAGENDGLTGTIPSEIGLLTRLTSLLLGTNKLTGTIPSQIGSLTNLTLLNLGANQLNGSFPTELGQLLSIKTILIYRNRISSTIAKEFGKLTQLQVIEIDDNLLTGSIPREIFSATDLTAFDFDSNPIRGSIPTEIGNLRKLVDLSLRNMSLTGPIPKEIGLLTNVVRFHMSSNNFTGGVPTELCNLSLLKALNLGSSIHLGGTFPTEFGLMTGLDRMFMANNNFVGSIPLEIGKMTSLRILDLQSNKLTGTIPTQIVNMTKLVNINLLHNQLTGTIPSEIGNLKLDFLSLQDNFHTGTVPSSLHKATTLTVLGLTNNYLTGVPNLDGMIGLTALRLENNRFSGLPTSLHTLTNLAVITVRNNSLGGSFPPLLYNLSKLVTLDISSCGLTGTIPAEVGLFSTTLLNFNFSHNSIAGTIPTEIGLLTSLISLDLRDNELTGSIPEELFLADVLFDISIGNNNLTGTIPSKLGTLVYLSQLLLESNSLTGTVPSEIGLMTSLSSLRLNHNQFSGAIPTHLGQLANISEISLGFNSLKSTVPSEIGLCSLLTSLLLNDNFLYGTLPPELSSNATALLSRHRLRLDSLSNLVVSNYSNNFICGTNCPLTSCETIDGFPICINAPSASPSTQPPTFSPSVSPTAGLTAPTCSPTDAPSSSSAPSFSSAPTDFKDLSVDTSLLGTTSGDGAILGVLIVFLVVGSLVFYAYDCMAFKSIIRANTDENSNDTEMAASLRGVAAAGNFNGSVVSAYTLTGIFTNLLLFNFHASPFGSDNLAVSRVVRFWSIYKRGLVLVFLETLAFLALYPVNADCPSHLSRGVCLEQMATYSRDVSLCKWSVDGCSLGEAPSDALYSLALGCILCAIAIPINLLIDYLLFEFVAKTPVLSRVSTDPYSGQELEDISLIMNALTTYCSGGRRVGRNFYLNKILNQTGLVYEKEELCASWFSRTFQNGDAHSNILQHMRVSRLEAEGVIKAVTEPDYEGVKGGSQSKQQIAMHYFILEFLTGMNRLTFRAAFIRAPKLYRETMNMFLWSFCSLVVLLLFAGMLIWIGVWTSLNGNQVLYQWGWVFAAVFLWSFFIVDLAVMLLTKGLAAILLHNRLRGILSAISEWTPTTESNHHSVVSHLSPTCYALNGPLYSAGVNSKIASVDDMLASRLISGKSTTVHQVSDVARADNGVSSGEAVYPSFYNRNGSDPLAVDVRWGETKWRVRGHDAVTEY